jgi:2-polyprenyl-6-hydroxyphenyl methylase/3-demethylubiquinone-9 3-methyltransferase
MARRGADVLGIDLSAAALEAARAHARESGVAIEYRAITAESLAAAAPAERFDVVTCLELLEHVPDPSALIGACARLARPDGHVFFSTINRNPKAYLLAVVAGEYVLGWLPRGTHDYARFLKPSEIDTWARAHGLALADLTGMHYDPIGQRWSLGAGVDVNYLAHYRADPDAQP